jgi:chromosomal replication initiator protein
MTDDQIWQSVLGQFELRVSQGNFLTWFRGTKVRERMGKTLVVETPSPFAHEWLSKKYRDSIVEVLKRLDKEIADVRFCTATQAISHSPLKRNHRITIHKNRAEAEGGAVVAASNKPVTVKSGNPKSGGFNSKYTFDSFVVGASNEVAYAACRAVADKPGVAYNPIFIYGGVGLGKTHLLQAVGNSLLMSNPKIRVLYVSSERFVNDFVSALQKKTTPTFRRQYRDVDVLIIDDIQFMAGKGKCQEELFHTFNTLYGENRQVILSSDRQPKAIPTLEERLSSRLVGGMIVDIKQPDYETRLAIVSEKVEQSNVEIPEEVLQFIAKNVQRNVRELEGALNKIIGYCEFNQTPATLPFVEKVLEGILQPTQKTVDGDKILEAVSTYYSVSLEDLCGKRRKKEIVKPRQVAMYLLRKENNLSFPSIGQRFGGRDHTTAMHACEKINKLLEHNNELLQEINFISELIYA